MVDVTQLGDQIDQQKDLGTGDAALWAYWMAQEKIAEREERDWIKRSRKIIQRYRDERPETARNDHRFNILWSNVQTLLPTLYARTPKPDVERRFRDEDPVGRLAATLLERSISYQLDTHAFDDVMQAAVQDRLLPGRGVARVMYVPHFGDAIPDQNGTPEQGNTTQEPTLRAVDFEEVKLSYVFWEDYREGPARQWEDVPWVRYRSFMTRDELAERFGEKGKQVSLDFSPTSAKELDQQDTPPDLYKKATILEFWDKRKREVCWLAPGTPDVILDRSDDPLELPGFFPNPDPLLATTTNDKRIPVPDYIEYQDQARELDTLSARIAALQKALKVAGVYPGEHKDELQQLIDSGENKLIAVSDWQKWSDGGGLKNFIDWLPIQQVAETLIQLYAARERAKQLLYEVTGIGDIMRGQTNPNETLGAQELKANFISRRIVPQQREVARFARDVIRLIAAVIANQFSAKTISMVTGYPQLQPVPQLPPPPPEMIPGLPGGLPGQPPGIAGPAMGMPPPAQMQPNPAFAQWQQMAQQVQAAQAQNQALQQQFEQAVELIKRDGLTAFRLDIEADSTIAPDEQAEKQARTEFMSAFVPLMEQMIPAAQGNPAVASLAKEVTLFAVRGFRVARPLEESIEKAFDAIGQMPPQPNPGEKPTQSAPQGSDPNELMARKYEADAKTQVGMAGEQTKAEIAAQANATKQMQITSETQLKTAELAQRAQNDQAHLVLDALNLQDRQAVRRVRTDSMEAREAQGLQ